MKSLEIARGKNIKAKGKQKVHECSEKITTPRRQQRASSSLHTSLREEKSDFTRAKRKTRCASTSKNENNLPCQTEMKSLEITRGEDIKGKGKQQVYQSSDKNIKQLKRQRASSTWYASLPEEKKEDIRAKKRARYASMSENEKKELRDKRRIWYATVSKEKKKELSQRKRESYAILSEKSKDELLHRNREHGVIQRDNSAISLCRHCGAKKFPYESKGFCCSNGDVVLIPSKIHPLIHYLLTSMDEEAVEFRRLIRTYNNRFAFTSLGVKYDKDLTKNTKNVYTFKVQGVIYHFICDIYPLDGGSTNLQFFFYDTEHEVQKRIEMESLFKEGIVRKLMDALSTNPYSVFFKNLRNLEDFETRSIFIKATPEMDQRVFNAPAVSQVAGIWIDDNDKDGPRRRDIIVHSHGGKSHHVNYYFGCYDPLQYPLLFPYGEVGWHEGIPKTGRDCNSQSNYTNLDFSSINSPNDLLTKEQRAMEGRKSRQNISCRQYYCYKLQIRPSKMSALLLSGRLLQQYIVDMYIKIETSRLDYIRSEQKNIRTELYQGVVDCINHGENRGSMVGRRIILPSSFIGGPRDMRRRYLDAMTLVQRYGKPDIFLTMTCNPSWPEIEMELLHPVEEAQNRPDLTTRIFRSQLEELKVDLLKRCLFGRVIAYTYVVEFQKRGLPHVHFLLILHQQDKIATPDAYDKFVCAEIPDKEENPHLHQMVIKHMMHGPCGSLKPNNSCMRDGKCKNYYLRDFCDVTTQKKNGYPVYRRRDTGIKVRVRNALLDNRSVVPYMPYLLAKYDCHINVEICSTIKAVKYLYKYIYKGHDKVLFQLGLDDNTNTVDEIKQFQNGRWVSPPEAAWRIFSFPMNEIHPAVISLPLHLERQQLIGFQDTQNLNVVIADERRMRTMLTEYFHMNATDERATHYLYHEFPEHYVWNQSAKYWKTRSKKEVVGRVVTANPIEGERYFLRCLLNHVKGATSHQNIKNVKGVQFSTYREAAEELGLLESDSSIYDCMQEATLCQMPSSLRRLFSTLLVYCSPQNPRDLWENFKKYMGEDYERSELLHPSSIESKVLQSIDTHLQSMGKNISSFDLPIVTENEDEKIQREISEELNIPVLEDDLQAVQNLNIEQRTAYDKILKKIQEKKGGVFFIDGPGGSGKTYLYRALLATIRSKGFVAIATATSGVAASLLPGGRTAHSRFKLPINTEETTCNMSKQCGSAELLRKAKLIIWDEISMANKILVEALESLLQDITGCRSFFGGKVVVFGGDFRQVLPVMPNGGREETIESTLVRSKHWKHIKKIRLQQNMRALNDLSFSNFLLSIGNGSQQPVVEDRIGMPQEMLIDFKEESSSKDELIDIIFPGHCLNEFNQDFITSRAILTTKNEFVDDLNERLITRFPGEEKLYYSFDSALDNTQQFHQEEFLNSLAPNGVPPHKLVLKKNCPIMLLRNIDPFSGLCNGTRLICKHFDNNIIDAEIAVGHHKGQRVFIPRIPIRPSDNDKFPYPFVRRQFPVRLCFAMTINKAQSQTMEKVGIYLPQPVFSHGQLYVALSRAKRPEDIKILIKPLPDSEGQVCTRNVVYKDLLDMVQR